MKINITSSCDKKVKYKIYGFDGDKRRLLRKGKFVHSAETEIDGDENRLIVRVRRYNLLIVFFRAICVGIANFFHSPSFSPMLRNITYHLFPFDEILVKDLAGADIMEIRYNPAAMVRVEYRLKQNLKIDYLICKTHPYEAELTGRNVTCVTLYTFAAIFMVALIAGVCLLIRFFVLHISAG